MSIDDLKSAFGRICRSVEDQGADCFVIHGSDFPLKTLVRPTPYFIEFNTVLQMIGQGFNPGSSKRFYAFLNQLNQKTNLAKLTANDVQGKTWTVYAKAMIVSGSESTNYEDEALSNLVTLWHQDIAKLIASKGSYQITGMPIN